MRLKTLALALLLAAITATCPAGNVAFAQASPPAPPAAPAATKPARPRRPDIWEAHRSEILADLKSADPQTVSAGMAELRDTAANMRDHREKPVQLLMD